MFTLIAGPCMAESYEILDQVAESLAPLVKNFDFYFKASFDKANRSSIKSGRGFGPEKLGVWFTDIKKKYGYKTLTDVHECWQVKEVSPFCDALQIPAFLCRQTDLLLEAVKSGRFVNIKKGQFMAPHGMQNIVEKAIKGGAKPENIAITERGTSFGYGDLVVDMRGFPIMAKTHSKIFMDCTHSLQQPATNSQETGGLRPFAPPLARAALATGYVNGVFMEIHPNPNCALSDAKTQFSISQGAGLIKQIEEIWKQVESWKKLDKEFLD